MRSFVFVYLCSQVRVVLKYRHCDGNLCIKVTDNSVVSYEMRLFGVQKDNFSLEHSLLHRHVVMKCMVDAF